MALYPYLMVDGAARAAIDGIRAYDRDSLIGVIGSESFPPYKRPTLTKGLWRGTRMEEIWLDMVPHDGEIVWYLGSPAVTVEPASHKVVTQGGGSLQRRVDVLGCSRGVELLSFIRYHWPNIYDFRGRLPMGIVACWSSRAASLDLKWPPPKTWQSRRCSTCLSRNPWGNPGLVG